MISVSWQDPEFLIAETDLGQTEKNKSESAKKIKKAPADMELLSMRKG